MIKFDVASQKTTTVDTFVVRYVEVNLVGGSVLAIIDQGQVVDGTFVVNGSLWVDIHPDGSFTSRDGSFVGTGAAGTIVSGLKTSLEGFLLASGAVTGTSL